MRAQHFKLTQCPQTWAMGPLGTVYWFTQKEELTFETIVQILPYRVGNTTLKGILWIRRLLRNGTEDYLGFAGDTNSCFREFLDSFAKKKGIPRNYWEVSYGLLVAVCKACEKDADGFRALLRKAKDSKELMGLFGVA